MFKFKTLLLLTSTFTFCVGQNNCEFKETCGECTQELNCVWCISPLLSDLGHCLHQNDSKSEWCSDNSLVNPKSSFKVVKNKPFTNTEGKVVQIRPQRLKINLRKGEEFTFQFQYAQAEDYPVDLYYIMDLSWSMEKHKTNLAKLGEKLAQTMVNITRNFRLGFGSFVDKVDLPFVSTSPEKLKWPCTFKKTYKNPQCAPSYSFKNHMSLSDEFKQFSEEVFNAKMSGNIDAPEGGFDALMQAIVCKSEIGWRAKARHLVVFSTDADFHIAGDGRLAGIIEPNDAQCHMKKHLYTHDLELDYPSVSQINHIARENNINIVFAIAEASKRVVNSYKTLSEHIENSNMGILDDKSDNVIQLVIDNYNKIVDSVTLSTNSSSDVEITITPRCQFPKINGCTNIHVGEVVNFTATIKPLSCSEGSNKKTIYIKPEGVEESIFIDIEVLCVCDCESPNNVELNSPNCSKSGTLKCGMCQCNSGFFGQSCECNRETSASNDSSQCKPNLNDTKVCSGLGVCQCGQCICNSRPNLEEKIFGKFCECDNYSCKRVDGKLCSEKGSCECGGVCKCQAGWMGDSCQCPIDNSACVKPGNDNLICNGHGTCSCGKCQCYDEEVRYSGKYCDECPSCSGQRCRDLIHCVQCQVHKKGLFDQEECKSKCPFTTEIVEKLDSENENTKICSMTDDNCRFLFQYGYSNNKELIVKAERKKHCPSPLYIVHLSWMLGVIVSIVVAGFLIIIVWKICTTIHDRREYAKFENERKSLRWNKNENPLYKGATSTFDNPVYGTHIRMRPKDKSQ